MRPTPNRFLDAYRRELPYVAAVILFVAVIAANVLGPGDSPEDPRPSAQPTPVAAWGLLALSVVGLGVLVSRYKSSRSQRIEI